MTASDAIKATMELQELKEELSLVRMQSVARLNALLNVNQMLNDGEVDEALEYISDLLDA